MSVPFFNGFAIGFSLILAIGAQNALVLRQGLKREHVFWLCLFCSVSDAILITAGVLGFGALVSSFPSLPYYMALAGAAFLFFYGATRFYAAWKGQSAMDEAENAGSLARLLAIAAAFTWANPHVYLDTVGLIGAISTQFHSAEKLWFGIGAVASSFTFFFALGYGAKFLAPYFQSRKAWIALDVLIGIVMFWLAISLLLRLDELSHLQI